MPSNNFYFATTDENWLAVMNHKGLPGDAQTAQRVEVITHPAGGKWAAVIPLDSLSRLSWVYSTEEIAQIQAGLKTLDQMLADGWTNLLPPEEPNE